MSVIRGIYVIGRRPPMIDQSPLPRFRNPPVSEVAIGVQFEAPMLTPVHLGLFYQSVKARFPTVAVQAPLQPYFETFGSGPLVGFDYYFIILLYIYTPTNLCF